MRLNDALIETLQKELNEVHVEVMREKTVDYPWYVIASELIHLYGENTRAIERRKKLQTELQELDTFIEVTRRKEDNIFALFEKLHKEREARKNGK